MAPTAVGGPPDVGMRALDHRSIFDRLDRSQRSHLVGLTIDRDLSRHETPGGVAGGGRGIERHGRDTGQRQGVSNRRRILACEQVSCERADGMGHARDGRLDVRGEAGCERGKVAARPRAYLGGRQGPDVARRLGGAHDGQRVVGQRGQLQPTVF